MIQMVLVTATAVCLLGLSTVPAVAVPTSAQTSADRVRVDRAVAKLEAVRKQSAAITARMTKTSSELDSVIAEQERVRKRLGSRALNMYRSGNAAYVSVLLGASTFENFTSRWDLLTRMNRQDAQDLQALAIARAKAEKSAKSLMDLQAEELKAVESQAAEVARARKDFASSQAALKEYEARTAAAAKPSSPSGTSAKKSDPKQQLSGAGEWTTSLASHYSWTFGSSGRGRGASGKSINPSSMMVAHMTLPFGTLIEFEYNGKRAVASVEDRGPNSPPRVFDLGPGLARTLNFTGVHTVRWRVIRR